MEGFRMPAGFVPLLSRMCGNAMPGAPVTASMSDGESRNQGGTVEYICIPPLIFQGMGYFFTLPNSKRRNYHVRRKSVHL